MALISLRFLKPRKRARRKPQGGPGQAPRSICVGPSHWKTPFLAFRSPGKPQGRGYLGFYATPRKFQRGGASTLLPPVTWYGRGRRFSPCCIIKSQPQTGTFRDKSYATTLGGVICGASRTRKPTPVSSFCRPQSAGAGDLRRNCRGQKAAALRGF